MVQVINIKKEFEPLLSFLYPTYSITDGVHGTKNFITHHDVESKNERETLDLYYEDCIFISTRIFDAVWDEEVLKGKCVEFANSQLKNRKKKITADSDTFVQDCIGFMFSLGEGEEEDINELFDAFGSMKFPKVFFEKSEKIPVQRLIGAMNTFITKILTCNETSSVYYKGKANLYRKKIRQNMIPALDAFTMREFDNSGLSACKFFVDLSS